MRDKAGKVDHRRPCQPEFAFRTSFQGHWDVMTDFKLGCDIIIVSQELWALCSPYSPTRWIIWSSVFYRWGNSVLENFSNWCQESSKKLNWESHRGTLTPEPRADTAANDKLSVSEESRLVSVFHRSDMSVHVISYCSYEWRRVG